MMNALEAHLHKNLSDSFPCFCCTLTVLRMWKQHFAIYPLKFGNFYLNLMTVSIFKIVFTKSKLKNEITKNFKSFINFSL